MLKIAVAAGVALLLSGCAGPGSPASTATTRQTPPPTATAAASTTPAHTLPLACPDVMPDDDLTLLFGEAYTPASESSLLTGPHSAALRNAGGMACSWGSGLGREDYADPVRDILTINLLPGTTAERWDEYASVYRQNPASEAFGDGSGSNCHSDENRRACYSDILVGDVWVEMHLEGVNPPAGETGVDDITSFVRPIIERLVERVAAASASESAVPSPAEIDPRTDCDPILPLDAVRDLLQITEDGTTRNGRDGEGGGGLNLRLDAHARAGLTTCVVGPHRSDFDWASATILPDGVWVFEPAAVEDGVWDDAEPVDIVGADSAYEECPLGGATQCTVDMAVGSSWVRVVLAIDRDIVVDAGHRANLLALAALVAGNLG